MKENKTLNFIKMQFGNIKIAFLVDKCKKCIYNIIDEGVDTKEY